MKKIIKRNLKNMKIIKNYLKTKEKKKKKNIKIK